jgi:dipeptidyl aminopeptidase/acylaminoacyl peptidase
MTGERGRSLAGRWVVAGLVTLFTVPTSIVAQTPSDAITIDLVSAIRYPTSPAWSPDATRVAFLWDAAGKQDLYVTMLGGDPIQLTDFAVDPDMLTSDISGFDWISSDEILFGKDGQLWRVSVEPDVTQATAGESESWAEAGTTDMAARPERVAALRDAGSFSVSPDRRVLAFTKGGDLWTASVGSWNERRVSYLPEGLSASSPMFSPDARHLAFTAARRWTEEEPLPYNGTIVRTFRSRSADERLGIISVRGGDPIWVPLQGDASSVQWTADGELLFQETSADRKTRTIRVFSPEGGVRTLWRDHDPAWWSVTGRDSRTVVSPDGRQVAFVSDRTGWPHVYVMPVDATSESDAVQLTSGDFGAGLPAWSPDGRWIAYHHSMSGNQMERFIGAVEVAGGQARAVVTAPGLNLDPSFSPDGAHLLLLRTDTENSQDIFVAEFRSGPHKTRDELTRLSNSMPPPLRDAAFTAPEPVSFPSRVDGAEVPATLMVPEHLDRSERHPAIVWIHGSGSDQNYLGWHPGAYRMYYSAHQYLAQQGYIILTPDYRGSSGYHRDWATGHYMDLGGADYLDVASGADYLKTLDFVDPDRIGVWGLSYGGFMTLQALTVTPTLFTCGINVAGVGDWATWSTSGWITGRMGTPAENPEIFHRLAPVKHMEALQRPLLVMHGTADVNVAFRESLTLIDALVKLRKDFETVVYPGEEHFFRREHVLVDAWTRAEQFFDECLR